MLVIAASSSDVPAAERLRDADYAAAAALLEGNAAALVRNDSVAPHWIGRSRRFWYRSAGVAGPEFFVVDATNGRRTRAFDHARLARALAKLAGQRGVPKSLPTELRAVELTQGLTQLRGLLGARAVECDLRSIRCQFAASRAAHVPTLPSPDGTRALLARDHDLYVVEQASGLEHRLTTDGVANWSWGKVPDSLLLAIPLKKGLIAPRPFAASWSPDGRFLLAGRVDERKVGRSPLVEWVPSDGSRRPILHEVRTVFPGDLGAESIDLVLFDTLRGLRIPVFVPEPFAPSVGDAIVVGWSVSRRQVFILARSAASKSAAVFRVDAETGRIDLVHQESSESRFETNPIVYNRPNIRILGDGADLLWYSERSGWGHLYLYDAQTGRSRRKLTQGAWMIHDVLAIDESRREAFVSATPRGRQRDPYLRQLYRIDLDARQGPVLLTDERFDHHLEGELSPLFDATFGLDTRFVSLRPDLGVFLDTWSTVSEPPITALRSTRNGKLIAVVERADASALYAAGWRPPVRMRVKAADGETDLYATYQSPYGALDDGKYPVIDAAYGGPQVSVAPRNFVEAYRGANPISRGSLARLGFAVVTVDARGTAGRNRAFREAGYPDFASIGVEDHVAALRQIAERQPEVDLERVGVYGWSWGGSFAAQSILTRPEFFKVAVSGAGVYDYAATFTGFEAFIGSPRFQGGSSVRTSPSDAPQNWRLFDQTARAAALTGKLLIVFADLDENVPPQQAARLVAALIYANRPFDLLMLPGRNHAAQMEGYTIKRTWDYFVEHLLGSSPPAQASVVQAPPAQLLHRPLSIE